MSSDSISVVMCHGDLSGPHSYACELYILRYFQSESSPKLTIGLPHFQPMQVDTGKAKHTIVYSMSHVGDGRYLSSAITMLLLPR